ncbi:hypothetical protein [Saccharibacillus sacchari]|uniref:Uncharacterized protein n=1 Tax=Saccharibacillus sacchari TaxID=456493 RepID=A0ACC6P9G8_9BACL
MSQDARIGSWPSYDNIRTLQQCEDILGSLPILQKTSARQWLYELGDRWMIINLSYVNEAGDVDEGAGCNVLDTHVPWANLRGDGAMWAYTQLRLHLATAFGWSVLDLQSGDLYQPLPLEDVAQLYALPDVAAKGAVPVRFFSWTEDRSAVRYRKKDRLIAKTEPRASYSALIALDDERVLQGYKGGSFVSDIPGIQLRVGDDLKCEEELTGGGRSLALRADQKILLSDGPLSQGYNAHLLIHSLSPLQTLSSVPLPLSPPFAWVPDTECFLAVVPRKNTSEQDFGHSAPSAVVDGNRLLISDDAVNAHPWLHKALDPTTHHLIEVDPQSQSWRPVIAQQQFAEAFGSYEGSAIDELILSPDGRYLYVSNRYYQIACFDLAEDRFIWSTDLHDNMRVYTVALSPCGRYLAIGGLAEDRNCPESFSLLHARTGQFVYRLPISGTFSSAIYSATWHPTGTHVILGLANGTIIELQLNAEARSFKALKGGITAICFQSERLLVTGAEKVVRAWSSRE